MNTLACESDVAIMRDHIVGENDHDNCRTIANFRHSRFEIAPLSSVSDRRQAVHDMLAGTFAGTPDFHVDVQRLHHADEAVVAEFVITDIRAPLQGSRKPDDGSTFRWRGFSLSTETE